MKKRCSYLVLLVLLPCMPSFAALEGLNNDQLQQVDGQAGADISLELKLNHTTANVFDTSVCPANNLEYCRLAFSLSNRYHDGSQDTYDASGNRIPSTTGRKQWLVFKGIQGTINIQKIGLDGVDLQYNNGTTNILKPAIQLSFDAAKPILIRNLGFQSLAIETDDGANEVGPGYLKSDKYCSSSTGTSSCLGGNAFDGNNPLTNTGREKGFLGINMNGNLAVGGTIKMFSCEGGSGGHPRC